MVSDLAKETPAPEGPFWRRWVLNFGTVYLALYFLVFGQPFLFFIPEHGLYLLADAFHQVLFRTHLPPYGVTGGGDGSMGWMLMLLNLLFSLLSATLWTVMQKNAAPQHQVNALRSFLRFSLAAWLLMYGLPKFTFMQFGLLTVQKMASTYGESSPMGLLWRFMAASPGYQWLAGVAETLPALLLLHRRTVTPGALIAAVTLTNVFALNLFYDVPVKLFSGHLLLAAVVLLLMDAPQLFAFAIGKPAPALDLPPASKSSVRASWVFTALGVLGITFTGIQGVQRLSQVPALTPTSQNLLKTRGFHLVNEQPFNK